MTATLPSLQQKRPHERITTQNLLVSAAFFERTRGISKQSLEDLTILIDLYCLYDRLIVLGRGSRQVIGSELINSLSDDVIQVAEVEGPVAVETATAAARHLAACLNKPVTAELKTILKATSSPEMIDYVLQNSPDSPQDVRTGMRLLSKLTIADAVTAESRAYMFVRRSFIYLGYASATGRVFTPDFARAPILAKVMEGQTIFRDNTLKSLGRAWTKLAPIDQGGITRAVPPLAAVVLDRASPDPKRIAREIRNLRDELTPLRRRLRNSEFKLASATAGEAIRTLKEWQSAFTELEKTFGSSERQATFEGVLNVLPEAAAVAVDPRDPVNWAKALSKVPGVATKVLTRRRLLELHQLAKKAPGPERLASSVRELFGDVTLRPRLRGREL